MNWKRKNDKAMKKLFLFALFAALCCSCSESGTDDQEELIRSYKIEVSASGGEVFIKNRFSWKIDSECKDWITHSRITLDSNGDFQSVFNIAPNTNEKKREGKITYYSDSSDGITSQLITATICQGGTYTLPVTVHVPTRGTFQEVLKKMGLDAGAIVSLKITGALNDEDIISMQSMKCLRDLDISRVVNFTELPSKAFSQSTVEKLILPNTLVTIGEYAFSWSKLTSIEIPSSVETMGMAAFLGCSKLATVTFKKGSQLKTIRGKVRFDSLPYINGTFSGCTALTAIEIPASVETIEETAFQGCSSLATVTFEKGSRLHTIEGEVVFGGSMCPYYTGAFLDCTALTAIEIPASVERIGVAAFQGCSSLATVTFEKGSRLHTIEGKVYSYSPYYCGTFSKCEALTAIEIPASVETIKGAAFYNCSSLATVTFEKGSRLKIIGDFHASYPYLYLGAFLNCRALTSIEIPASVERIGRAAFKGCSSLAIVTFETGSQLETIGGGVPIATSREDTYYYGAFYGLKNLKTVDMSACTQVKTIEAHAFGGRPSSRVFLIGTEIPPTCGKSALGGYSLKVPSGSIDAYKAASGWKDFANISGLDE